MNDHEDLTNMPDPTAQPAEIQRPESVKPSLTRGQRAARAIGLALVPTAVIANQATDMAPVRFVIDHSPVVIAYEHVVNGQPAEGAPVSPAPGNEATFDVVMQHVSAAQAQGKE
jgi:hypothetical protein